MANIRKSFNFRNGVQVDNDNFVVNANGLVGIGTSIPTESLDLIGNTKISGLTTTTTLGVAQTSNFYGDVNIGSNVTIDPTTGNLSATKFIGDASGLQNIVAISTTGWIAQGVGLHTFRSIGIGTTNPEYYLQIGENPASGIGVGITDGNIHASGIITATTFRGTFDGDVTGVSAGIALTATKLQTARDFNITGDLEASTISFDGSGNVSLASTLSSSFSANTSGIITASEFSGTLTGNVNASSGVSTFTRLEVDAASITNANITGVGTFNDLRVNKSSDASLVITSLTNSSVSIGESVGAGNSSAQLLYSPATGRLDINNYDVGGVNINLHEGTGTGTTESFSVNYNNTKQFEVTYDGKIGINRDGFTLENALEVGGDMSVSNNAVIAGILTVTGTAGNSFTLGDGSPLPISDTQNFNTSSGISTFNDFNIGNELTVSQDALFNSSAYIFGPKVGIGTTNGSEFRTGPVGLIMQATGSIWADNGFYTAGKVIITNKADGSEYTDDDRIIPSNLGSTVPYVSYGDFQAECGGASFIANNLMLVPSVGVATVGFGTTNGVLVPSSFLPGGNRYLSKVGINTYYSRGLVDIGMGSTTMNSYVILPSLSDADVNIVSNLWQASSGFGTADSKKITPNGVPGGALLYNTTKDKIQVRNTASSFRNLSPVVAFATINNGTLVANSSTGLSVSNSSSDANFTLTPNLQSASYSVVVSNNGTSTYTVLEADKSTSGFKVTFTSSASAKTYSVMILQV